MALQFLQILDAVNEKINSVNIAHRLIATHYKFLGTSTSFIWRNLVLIVDCVNIKWYYQPNTTVLATARKPTVQTPQANQHRWLSFAHLKFYLISISSSIEHILLHLFRATITFNESKESCLEFTKRWNKMKYNV